MNFNLNNNSYNPSFGRLDSHTFANIPITIPQPIKEHKHQTKTTNHNYNQIQYHATLEKFQNKIKAMVKIIEIGLVQKIKRSAFQEISIIALLPKFKSEAEKNVIELLKNSLTKLNVISNRSQRQNLNVGFNKILMKSVTSVKNQPYQRYSDFPLKQKQNENYYNLNDFQGLNKKTSGQQLFSAFLGDMHKLLDNHSPILNQQSNKNFHKVIMSPNMQKNRFSSDKSKPKYPPKKQ